MKELKRFVYIMGILLVLSSGYTKKANAKINLQMKKHKTIPQIHMIYSLIPPDYLGLMNGPNWKIKTLNYLTKFWNQVKNDPNPALEIGYETSFIKKEESVSKIIKIAKGCEKRGIHFYLFVAGPFPSIEIQPSIVEKVFKVAPHSCKGVYLSEPLNSGYGWNYLQDLIEIANLCKQYHRKMVWAEHSRDGGPKGVGWWGYPLHAGKDWAKMFNKSYANVIVPLDETNDPRTETLNMGAVLGMWLGGLSHNYGFSIQDWWWHDSPYGHGHLLNCPPELISRMLLESASLGATYYQFESWNMIWKGGIGKLAPIYKYAIKPFINLYKNRKIEIPTKTQLLSFSPLGIKELLTKDESNALFESLAWNNKGELLKETPDYYIPHYFYNEKHYQWGLIPETPFGILILFPSNVKTSSISRLKWCKKILKSNGSISFYNDKTFSPLQTKKFILSTMNKGKALLPIHVKNAYVSLTRLRNGRYLIWLINSIKEDPPNKPVHKIYVTINLSIPNANSYMVYNRETGKLINSIHNGEFTVSLKHFRLLELKLK